MNIQAEKIKLVQTILNLESETVIKQIKAVLENNTTDFWDEMPDEIKASVMRGIKQADKGEFKNHDEVMKKLASKCSGRSRTVVKKSNAGGFSDVLFLQYTLQDAGGSLAAV